MTGTEKLIAVTFGCKITDRDYLAAFAPEQPAEVKVGQVWMCAADGAELPVKRVRADAPFYPLIDLGGASLTVVVGEPTLRQEWVCTSPPENVTLHGPLAETLDGDIHDYSDHPDHP